MPIRDRNKDQINKETCGGNPIYPLTGAKSNSLILTVFAGHEIRLEYSTRKALGNATSYFDAGQVVPPPAGAGPMWSINIQKQFYRASPYQMIYLGGGKWDMFTGVVDGEGEKSEGYGPDLRLLYKNNLWHVSDKPAGFQYQFSSSSSGYSQSVTPLIAFQPINGPRITLQQETPYVTNDWRSVSLLKTIKDAFGRQVQLQYEIPSAWSKAMPRLTSLTDGNGSISLSYNEKGMLQRVTWPDASYQEFLYESGQDDKPWLLTGVRDENQALTATYTYDDAGRALSTQSAGGANRYAVIQWQQPPMALVNRWYDPVGGIIWRETAWSDAIQAEVQTANGETNIMQTKVVNGMPRITAQSQPAASGCAASVRLQDYDLNGNVAWREDATSHRTCYANDLNRNLETARVEGLAAGSACDTLLAGNAALPTGARKVSSAWHPVWRQEVQVAEPRRLTTWVYNGQPDPFNGNAMASCASGGTLPDGSALIVLCKQVEQATSDVSGAQGFAATVDTTVPNRVQQWTYNQHGQVLTYKDPLNNTTTYAYYTDTTADHTKGDLYAVTNAKSQKVAEYTKYNAAGHWLEMKDINDVVTTRTFDARQRLRTINTAGAQTAYDYWPTGLLKSVTLPDSSSLNYGYDDAHRLTSITDNLGNSITYTLDNAGNRTGEAVKDPSGNLARSLARVPDALNRIQQITGRP